MRLLAFLVVLLLPVTAWANDWDALDRPGAIAIMRHALAPGTGDPSGFTLGDCTTQRNLSASGREQARRIGAAFRERGIDFSQVLSSQWCRSRETAELLELGAVRDAPSLNSFFQDYASRDQQTRETLDLIRSAAGRLMLVTHQVNISALTGRGTRSGEVLIIREEDGEIDLIGSILIAP